MRAVASTLAHPWTPHPGFPSAGLTPQHREAGAWWDPSRGLGTWGVWEGGQRSCKRGLPNGVPRERGLREKAAFTSLTWVGVERAFSGLGSQRTERGCPAQSSP